MGILLAYFVWVTSMLAVIAAAWIGIGDSAGTRLHLQRATLIQHSYDAAVMAGDFGNAPPKTIAAATTAKAAVRGGSTGARHVTARRAERRVHTARARTPGPQYWARPGFDGATTSFAMRGGLDEVH
ncbi:MAG TPA: hypothetical protein VL048_12495 [Xanthobacteraceae bacterium]|nr:hypothetical protein [Xanthobacteraceae bacterium]